MRVFTTAPSSVLWMGLLLMTSLNVSYHVGGLLAKKQGPTPEMLASRYELLYANRQLQRANSDLQTQVADFEWALNYLASVVSGGGNVGLGSDNTSVIPAVATVYHPVIGQCDADPSITADGTVINPSIASSYNYLAVSRDLHTRYGGPIAFGDRVYLANAGLLNGFYEVRDLLNTRFTSRVDVLTDAGGALSRHDDAVLLLVQR